MKFPAKKLASCGRETNLGGFLGRSGDGGAPPPRLETKALRTSLRGFAGASFGRKYAGGDIQKGSTRREDLLHLFLSRNRLGGSYFQYSKAPPQTETSLSASSGVIDTGQRIATLKISMRLGNWRSISNS